MNTKDTRLQPTSELHWFKSSYSSGAGGECVEVVVTAAGVSVRDSKRAAQGGPVLKVGSEAWIALLETV
ncbi:DUF397 domain-containing protein [Streptomyces lancefieldiae]|uniref:DUF397 domain-containing protein n=1 Tax=Streptomyces lancefieldiae TaxID=3075520 RepID=A0ABU3AES7_9ACTN|nr:DUF397 domain-containing protein [Streptomyces sp. DSM 40712]MDT0608691.1 DUF397 domain-containing protein [Streptomyces sp. DSM 40712]